MPLFIVQFANLTENQRKNVEGSFDGLKDIKAYCPHLSNGWLIKTKSDDIDGLAESLNPNPPHLRRKECLITPFRLPYEAVLSEKAKGFIEKHGAKEIGPALVPPKAPRQPSFIDPKDRFEMEPFRVREYTPLNDLILPPDLRNSVAAFLSAIKFKTDSKAAGYVLPESFHNILVSGASGVGKTTLAIALMMEYAERTGKQKPFPIYVLKPSSFIARFSGQTINNLEQAFTTAAQGGIVFDEIDTISTITSFGREAINALNTHMGNHMNSPLIAGTLYESGLPSFLNENVGLSSRFGTRLSVPSQNNQTLAEILIEKIRKTNFGYDSSIKSVLVETLHGMRKTQGPSFGHIREAENLLNAIFYSLALRYEQVEGLNNLQITAADVPERDFKTGELRPRAQVVSSESTAGKTSVGNVVDIGLRPKPA